MFRVLCAGLFAAAVTFLAGCDTKPKPSKFKGGARPRQTTTKRTPGI